ncbi:MAG: transporter substrate-binding domain-containing protein, partial [Gammaproteobacteria bacterium]|nr:transporter substrate-binding domain-containing protein [Gammaproteobacteria bacterium]
MIKYLLILLCLTSSLHANEPQSISLTKEEQEWIKSHQKITFGTDKNWRPYVIPKPNGSIEGVEPELLDKINSLTGLNIELIVGKWPDMLQKAKQKEIDGLAISAYHKERGKDFLFSDSPYRLTKYIIAKDDAITSMESLKNKRVGLRRGNQLENKLLRDIPGIKLIPGDSDDDLLLMLQNKKVEALIGSGSLYYSLLDKMMPGFKIAFIVPGSETPMLYSTRKDWPELNSIINKALSAIPESERTWILRKWGASFEEVNQRNIYLTKTETDYLKKRGPITFCVDPDWMPFESIKNGKHIGLASDYWNLVKKSIPGKIELLPTKSWEQTIEFAKNQKCDIINFLNKNEERSKFLIFTRPYVKSPMVIVTKDENPYVSDLDKLAGKTIALVEGYNTKELVQKNYPNINIISANTQKETLQMVSNGTAYATIGSLISVNNLIKEQGLSNLKISGTTGFYDEFRAGITKQDTLLRDIIQKALDSISEEESLEISNKWTSVKYVTELDYGALIKTTIIFVSILSVMLYLFYKQQLLKNYLKTQRQFVQRLLDSQEQIIITTDGNNMITANLSFIEFFDVKSVEDFKAKYNVRCICDMFDLKAPEGYLQTTIDGISWIEYNLSRNSHETNKVMITRNNTNHIFSVSS